MKKAAQWLLGAGLFLALVGGCSGAGVIRFDPTAPRVYHRESAEDVVVYDIDCQDTDQGTYCSYLGQPLPWRITGVFRVSDKGLRKWDTYRKKVRSRGAEEGCQSLAVRRNPPTLSGLQQPIGALCIEAQALPQGTPVPTLAPGVPQAPPQQGLPQPPGLPQTPPVLPAPTVPPQPSSTPLGI